MQGIYPTENGVIALLLIAAIGVMAWRLFLRGPSRMTRALYLVAGGILTFTLIGLLVSWLGAPDQNQASHSTGSASWSVRMDH
ncbi:hypothetical protein [Fodinicola feengrottensis]|uniref:Uncharacterized protein n=1 Tax=Fodinicola feengrottensis TaxID=435914 RepID=A0ABN2I8D1_9ACTN|nr:hypothetical protein [Fodinicola feengrottensis]